MKIANKIIICLLVVIVLFLGIGYASISNISLNIKGSVKADPSQANFKVKFTGVQSTSSSKVKASITNDTNATISVSGLSTKGETVTAVYKVKNTSADLSANLSVSTTNENTTYYTVQSSLGKTTLKAGEETTVTVTVKLAKEGTQSTSVKIALTAKPVQPE